MDSHISRRAVVAAGALALAGCTGSGREGLSPTDRRTTNGSSSTPVDETARAGGPPISESSLPVAYEFEALREAVRSGGPPKDGIPAIDEPKFVSPDETPTWLTDREVVFGIVRGDDVKAYPQRVLVWHEICNDVVDGVPVSVTYCPLTGTAMGFDRGETTFGVSGKLLNSNLVMYDRATDSRWPQMLGTAIEGPFEGESLREFGLVWTTWGAWKAAHPDTKVLSTETGYVRDYQRDPYGDYNPLQGYYFENQTMFAPLTADDRLEAKTVVVGSRSSATPVAFSLDSLRNDGWRSEELDGKRLLAVYDERYDTAYFYSGPGSTSVASLEGRTVTLGDESTHAVDDLPFERVYAYEAMWFAWAGFYPETRLVGGGS